MLPSEITTLKQVSSKMIEYSSLSELLVPIERANNSELPKNINLKPSHQFLEISKIPLRDGLKYDIKYTGEPRAS